MNKKNVQKRNSNAHLTKRPSLKSKADSEMKALSLKQSQQKPVNSHSRPISKSKTGLPLSSQNSFSSFDSENIESETKELEKALKTSLKVFKSATSDFISKNNETELEVEVFQQNFFQVQSEVAEILQETAKSRTEMQDMKKKLGETLEKVNDLQSKLYIDESMTIGLDFRAVDKKSAKNRLTLLKSELFSLKSQIKSNEESLKSLDSENNDLRLHSYRLKETFCQKKFSQKISPPGGCESCETF